jgi:hypothetical protein
VVSTIIGTTRHGNRWLTNALGTAAMAAARTKDTIYLGARYQRSVRRLGKKKAIVAVEHSIVIVVWHMLTRWSTCSIAVLLISAAAVGIGDVDLACYRKQHLPKYVVPRSGVIIDAMPLNDNGKIRKRIAAQTHGHPRTAKQTYGIF